MAAREIRAGRAFVSVSLKDMGVKTQLEKLSRNLKSFGATVGKIGTAFAGAGTATLAPLVAAAQQFASAGAELNRMSKQTGVAVSDLSALGFAAKSTGAEVDDLSGLLEEMNIRIGEAALDGTGAAAEAMKKLGLSAREMADMTPIERFRTIAQAISEIQNTAERGFMADEMFGGDAFRLLPLLNEGADGIDALMQKARDLGVVLSEEDAKAAAELTRAMGDLKNIVSGAAIQVGAAVAGPLTKVISRLVDWAKGAIDVVKTNRELIKVVAGVGFGLVALGGALVGVASAFTMAGFAASGFGAIIGLMSSPIVVVGAALGAIGIAVGAVAAKFADSLGVFDSFKESWGAIGDALKNANFQAAAFMAIESLKIGVLKGASNLIGVLQTIVSMTLQQSEQMVKALDPFGVTGGASVLAGIRLMSDMSAQAARGALGSKIDASESTLAKLRAKTGAAAPTGDPTGAPTPGSMSDQLGGVLDLINNPGKLANRLGSGIGDAIGMAMQETEGLRKAAGEMSTKLFEGLSSESEGSPAFMQRRVEGTFSAFAASRLGMGGQGPQEETAKNTGIIAKNTRRLLERQSEGAVFA